MEINVKDAEHIVEIWLSNAVQKNAGQSIKSIIAKYNAKKYTIAVFNSGNEDLFCNTERLLLCNR